MEKIIGSLKELWSSSEWNWLNVTLTILVSVIIVGGACSLFYVLNNPDLMDVVFNTNTGVVLFSLWCGITYTFFLVGIVELVKKNDKQN